ncbi:MAG TPA: DUF4070 domain-containing protein, partial [Terriglobales bacterium]|nr:DUF4070 domain-containing protein [Terriglobales bacterium]
DAVRRINDHGIEVVSGIILGLDTDGPDTADHVIEFIRASNIPVLTINVLYALPKTPLWRRLEAAGRLVGDEGRESNVDFLMPYESVLDMWRRCIATAYAPEEVYARYAHQQTHTFPNRFDYPRNAQRESWDNMRMAVGLLGRIVWRIGVRAPYRRTFWRMAWPALKSGKIEQLIHIATVTYHLIAFTEDCLRGAGESSFYAPAPATATPSAAAV